MVAALIDIGESEALGHASDGTQEEITTNKSVENSRPELVLPGETPVPQIKVTTEERLREENQPVIKLL